MGEVVDEVRDIARREAEALVIPLEGLQRGAIGARGRNVNSTLEVSPAEGRRIQVYLDSLSAGLRENEALGEGELDEGGASTLRHILIYKPMVGPVASSVLGVLRGVEGVYRYLFAR